MFLGERDWSESVASSASQGYVARAREWGLVETKLVEGRYALTPLRREDGGRGAAAAGDRGGLRGETMSTVITDRVATRKIVAAAIDARTLRELDHVAHLIEGEIGAVYERPIGDRVQTLGLLSSQGLSDHKTLELITNGQDAIVELYALLRFGDKANVPYGSPHKAARELLGHLSADEQARLLQVVFHAEDTNGHSKRITPVVRDFGCGLTPSYVPRSIFYVGSQHKDEALWQQGAFGMGGALTYRNARGVIVVTRRHPDLLGEGEEDRITVAVCRWRQHTKGMGLFYLVAEPWPANRDADRGRCQPRSTPNSSRGRRSP